MMGDIPCLCGVHFCSAEVSTRTSGCKGPLGEVEYPFSRSRIYGAGYKCCTEFKRENLHGFSSVLNILRTVTFPVYPMRSGQVRSGQGHTPKTGLWYKNIMSSLVASRILCLTERPLASTREKSNYIVSHITRGRDGLATEKKDDNIPQALVADAR